MEAGKLDRKIVIEQKSVVRDAMGGETVTWATYKTIWANVNYVGSRMTEKEEGQKLVATRYTEFKFRYNDAPLTDEAMRISYDSGYYDIEQVQLLGRQESIRCITKLKI